VLGPCCVAEFSRIRSSAVPLRGAAGPASAAASGLGEAPAAPRRARPARRSRGSRRIIGSIQAAWSVFLGCLLSRSRQPGDHSPRIRRLRGSGGRAGDQGWCGYSARPDRQLDPHLASLLVMGQLSIILQISQISESARVRVGTAAEPVQALGVFYFAAHVYKRGAPAHRIKYGLTPVPPA
jgi:hypothetical protein